MLCPCRRFVRWLAAILASAALWPAIAAETFPFGSELMLDAPPINGSKRIPMLEIEDDGTASIDLWCASLQARATVGDGTITIVPGQVANLVQPPPCDSERQASDDALLAALAAATTWRRSGDRVDLSGGVTLHYRLMTN
jgi:hypothetical protein